MRVLVTGGAGFIGSHLSEALVRRGDQVVVLDSLVTSRPSNLAGLTGQPGFRLVQGSVTDETLLAGLASECEAIVHLAVPEGGCPAPGYLATQEALAASTAAVIEAAAVGRPRVVVASGSGVYGDADGGLLYEDDEESRASLNVTGWSRSEARSRHEQIAIDGFLRGIPVTVVRICNTVGPRQSAESGPTLARMARQAVSGEPVAIPGDGREVLAVGHVADVADGIIRVLDRPAAAGNAFNLGGSVRVPTAELAGRVLRRSGSDTETTALPDAAAAIQPTPGERRLPELTKAAVLLGHRPVWALDAIIDDAISAMRRQVALEQGVPALVIPRRVRRSERLLVGVGAPSVRIVAPEEVVDLVGPALVPTLNVPAPALPAAPVLPSAPTPAPRPDAISFTPDPTLLVGAQAEAAVLPIPAVLSNPVMLAGAPALVDPAVLLHRPVRRHDPRPPARPAPAPGLSPSLRAVLDTPKTPPPFVRTRAGRITVVMPVYNEERYVASAIQRIREQDIDMELIVVNDGSSDETTAELRKVSPLIDMVINHPANRGKGAAIRTGLQRATSEIVVFQDSDLELDPAMIPGLIEPIASGEADWTNGSRLHEGTFDHISSIQWKGNRLVSRVAALLYGIDVVDIASAAKAFRVDFLRRADLESEGFELEAELVAKMARLGARHVEMPISFSPRSRAQGKKVRYRDAVRVVRTLGRYRTWQPTGGIGLGRGYQAFSLAHNAPPPLSTLGFPAASYSSSVPAGPSPLGGTSRAH